MSRITDAKEKKRLEELKVKCDQELAKEIEEIEQEYKRMEHEVTVRI